MVSFDSINVDVLSMFFFLIYFFYFFGYASLVVYGI